MSELIQNNGDQIAIRLILLATTSAMVLCATLGAQSAHAEDADRPTVWIELGGQLERQTGQGDVFTPNFIANNPDSFAFNPVSPLHFERPPRFSQGLEAAVTFQPESSDWQFSASVRYGRSGGHTKSNRAREISHVAHYSAYNGYHVTEDGGYVFNPLRTGFLTFHGTTGALTQVEHKQSHAILDFMAGKDVGLGLFGRNGASTISTGVRFAQFQSKTTATINARPSNEFGYFYNFFLHYISPDRPGLFPTGPNFHTYAAQFHAERSFIGAGPSISWNASVPVLGTLENEALTFDWSANAAVLFGRQRASGSHQTSGHYRHNGISFGNNAYYSTGNSFARSQRVAIPNVGGMIGLSLKFPNAKVSLGYRGDFFFGAMDTGNDTRTTKTVGFYGPFATVSIGLGG